MNIKWILATVGALAVFACQLALVAAVPGGSYVYLSLIGLIFIVVLFDLSAAVFWFLLNGFLLDLFSFHWFGFYTALMMVILLMIYFLISNFLTNRSLYVFLLLTTVAVLVYDSATYTVFALSWHDFLSQEGKRLVINWLLTALVFYCLGAVSYRLRPVFLIRHK